MAHRSITGIGPVWRRWLGCFAYAALVGCGGGSPVAPEPATSIVALGPQVLRLTLRSPCGLPLGVLPMLYTRVTVTPSGSGWLASASSAAAGDVQVRFQGSGGDHLPGTLRVVGTIIGTVVHMPELLTVPSGGIRATFGDDGAVLDGFAFAAGTLNPTTAFLDGEGTGSLTVTPITTGESCTVNRQPQLKKCYRCNRSVLLPMFPVAQSTGANAA